MALVSVREIAEARTGSLDQTFARKYTRTFQVITDSQFDDAVVRTTPEAVAALYREACEAEHGWQYLPETLYGTR